MMSDELDRSGPTSADGEAADASTRRKVVLVLVLVALLVAIVGAAGFYGVGVGTGQGTGIPRSKPPAKDTPVYLRSIGNKGIGKLSEPTGVAVSTDGRVFVTDASAHAIKVFDERGTFLYAFQEIKDGTRTSLDIPVHVAVSPDGQVFVTDRRLRAMYVFNLAGRFIRKFPAPVATWAPLGVGFDDAGDVYVTDIGDPKRHRVLVLDQEGKELFAFGATREVAQVSDAPGSFYFPDSVVVHGDSVFVTDSNNRRIEVFDRRGAFQYLIATTGIPRGVAFDTKGDLLVVDTLGNQISRYTPGGAPLSTFGSGGGGSGQFQFPDSVAVDATGLVFVADRGNDQIQVWGPYNAATASNAASRPAARAVWLLAVPVVALLLLAATFVLCRRPPAPDVVPSEDEL